MVPTEWSVPEFDAVLRELRSAGTIDASDKRVSAEHLALMLNVAPRDGQRRRYLSSVQFSGAHFEGDVSFHGMLFRGDTQFEGARFAGSADFRDAEFALDANFDRAQFQSDVSFAEAEFGGRVLFASARVDGLASFEGARFPRRSCSGRCASGG